MTSAPAGQRIWKCPECGSEVMLSVVQLDPIACDACLQKLKGSETKKTPSGSVAGPSGPLGIWASLPETTKLGIAIAALVVGVVIGYKLGSDASPHSAATHRSASHSKEEVPADEPSSREESSTDPNTEERPAPPGPGYKWVKGRKHKDGTYGQGHWAKDPRASESK